MNRKTTSDNYLSEELIDKFSQALSLELLNRDKNSKIYFLFDSSDSERLASRFVDDMKGHLDVQKQNIFDVDHRLKRRVILIDCLYNKEDKETIDNLGLLTELNTKLIGLIYPTGYKLNSGMKISRAIKYSLIITYNPNVGIFLNDCLDSCPNLHILGDCSNGSFHLVGEKDTKPLFVARKRNTHKGSYLSVSIIGGSKEYTGAPVLSYMSLSSLKLGSGFSYLVVPESLGDLYALRQPQIIVKTMSDEQGNFIFTKADIDQVIGFSDVIAMGMGMGVSSEVYQIISYLLQNFKGRLVLDADGLNSLSKFGVEVLKEHSCEVVITPHIKEFSRLTNKQVEETEENGVDLAKKFASENNLVVVLKSASSIITDGKVVNINVSGNSGLAKAGSGDLLSGIIGGVLSDENINLISAASIGSYLLGKAAQDASKVVYFKSITCGDIVDQLGKTLKSLSRKKKNI